MKINWGLAVVCIVGTLVLGGMLIQALASAGPVLVAAFVAWMSYVHFSNPKA